MTYDFIVIGGGAAGATLAPNGSRILVMEGGEYLWREKDDRNANAVFNERRYTTEERGLHKAGKSFCPGAHYDVGGKTKFYDAMLVCFRVRERFGVAHAATTTA